jgi:hypothetical protein
MAATKERHADVPFAVTDLEQIEKITLDCNRLDQLVSKVVGRDQERSICRWGVCKKNSQYAQIQDTYDFLMYMDRNDLRWKDDPIEFVSRCYMNNLISLGKRKKENPLLSLCARAIRYACDSCENDEELIARVTEYICAQSIDDFFLILKKHGYFLSSAIRIVFDSIYPKNTIGNLHYDVKYSIMCWILIIKGHVKNEESFYDFRM